MEGAVARRYAEALLMLAQEQGKVEQLDSQSKQLAPVFADPAVRQFFGAPQIPAERKKQALRKALAGADALIVNLARLLVDKNRIGFLPAILREYDRLTDELAGVEEVTIASATPLSDAQREEILAGLKRFSAYGQLRVRTEVEPALLGGVVVRLGSRVLDGSVASRLRELRRHVEEHKYRGLASG